ncbi:MAG: hypothetical protein AAFQ41_03120 [Cyanobacteria bacterium J06623_7]
MSDLTLKQRFGTNAYIDLEGWELCISLSDLQDKDQNGLGDFTNGLGLDTSGLGEGNEDKYASKILWALIALSQQNQPEVNNDDEVGIYISSQGKRPVTRNGVAQNGFLTLVTGYQDDPSGLTLDPDDMRSGASDSSNG